jgi:hypothetical protein
MKDLLTLNLNLSKEDLRKGIELPFNLGILVNIDVLNSLGNFIVAYSEVDNLDKIKYGLREFYFFGHTELGQYSDTTIDKETYLNLINFSKQGEN